MKAIAQKKLFYVNGAVLFDDGLQNYIQWKMTG